MVEQPEDSNRNNLIRKIAGSYQHDPNSQECVGKSENNENRFEVLRDDDDVIKLHN